jgi:hypothetical protein
MFNVTLGLLAALCLIIASNMFFMEGLTNLNGDENPMIQPGLTVGDDNVPSGGRITVETKEKVKANAKEKVTGSDVTISELQEQSQSGSVDKESIRDSIESKSSKSIPVDKSTFRSEEVSASDPTTEPFVSSYSKF